MQIDLDRIIGAHRFEWDSQTLGKILVHSLTGSERSTLNAAHESYLDTDSFRFVKSLITAICQLDSDNSGKYSDDRISADQANRLTEAELNEFARKFLEKNPYLRNDLEKRKNRKGKNRNSELVTKAEYQKRNDAEKSEGETDCDFLKRVMHQYRVQQKELNKRIWEDIKRKNLFSNSVLDLIDNNKQLSNRLSSTLDEYPRIDPIKFPENPIYETNRQLEALGRMIKDTSSLVQSLNDSGRGMALELASGSKTARRFNTIMIIIGLITLTFSSVMSLMSYMSSSDTARITQHLLTKANADQNIAAGNSAKRLQESSSKLGEIRDILSIIRKQDSVLANKVGQLTDEISKQSKRVKTTREPVEPGQGTTLN